jgi:Replication-relaxation
LISKTKPANLAGTIRLLKRMAEDGEVKCTTLSVIDPEYYCLPKVIALNRHSHLHERLCGDLYVAFELSGQLHAWEKPEDYEEYKTLGLKPDRSMVLSNGTIVFWEIDRGGEVYRIIKEKVDKYVKLSRSHPAQRFHVVFTTIDDKQTAKSRCAGILSLLEDFKRGDQFLTLPHAWAVTEPLNPVFLSPLNPMGIALADVQP